MYTEIFSSFAQQTEKALAPYVKFNQLLTQNVEELTEMQLAALRTYSDLGLNQMKAASNVRDVQSLALFGSKQLETLTKLSKQMIDDGNRLSELAQQWKLNMDEMVAENMQSQKSA